jgi:hypothetical protein
MLDTIGRLFRTSQTSRATTIAGIDGSATASNTCGPGQTRQKSAPVLRNVVELIEGWQVVLSVIDPGQPCLHT